MYTNRKKSIHKKVDSLVSPFKKVTRDASLFMAEAPSALGQFQNFTKLFIKNDGSMFWNCFSGVNKESSRFLEKENHSSRDGEGRSQRGRKMAFIS